MAFPLRSAIAIVATAVAVLQGPLASAQDDLPMCGGFVKPASTFPPGTVLDYSQVKIRVYTKEGFLKSETECSPAGYYFIPLYDHGEFSIQLETPAGWTAVPMEYNVHSSGDGHSCSEDQNFEVTGFQVTGSVRDPSSLEGGDYSSVRLTLIPASDTAGAVPLETVPQPNGTFVFGGVAPGAYRLQASHSDWALQAVQDAVHVAAESVDLGIATEVTGYSVTGRVELAAGAAAGVLIVGEPSDPLASCHMSPEAAALLPSASSIRCATVTDAQGEFKLKGVPAGPFTVRPSLESAPTVVFHVEPETQVVLVAPGGAALPEPFTVASFDAKGRVLGFKGHPLTGVKVQLGSQYSITDSEGVYELERIPLGTAFSKVTAHLDHYHFSHSESGPLNPFNSNFEDLPDIQVDAVNVCGQVMLGAVPTSLERIISKTRTIVLSSSDSKEMETTTDANGHFCFQAGMGSFSITPRISSAEERYGLSLYPSSASVVVSEESGPIADVVFKPAQLSISGRVECLKKCPGSLKVVLRSGKDTSKDLVAAASSTGTFEFDGVWPGEYRVIPVGPSDEHNMDTWCWDEAHGAASSGSREPGATVVVKSDNVTGVHIRQTGYAVNIASDTVTEVTLVPSSLAAGLQPVTAKLNRGNNGFCVAAAGPYSVTADPCYQWTSEQAPDMTLRVPEKSRLAIKVIAYRIRGRIEVLATKEDSVDASNMGVSVKQGGDDVTREAAISFIGEENTARVFEYEFYAPAGVNAQVIPRGGKQGAELLFYPPSRTTRVVGSDCQEPVRTIVARPGLYHTGAIDPPLEGVAITVRALLQGRSKEEAAADLAEVELKPGDVVATTESNSDGSYSIGPLHSHIAYSYEASKPGYHFQERGGAGNFIHRKLGGVRVAVRDGHGLPVSGVLLSLSGHEFRSNNVSGNDGEFHFINLFPGTFFVRPMLKEYNFVPPSQSVEVGEGEDTSVQFTAQRYAYSAFGTVVSLNGAPEQGITVVAAAPSIAPETAVTDVHGAFRIRGLRPGKVYNIRVHSDRESPIARAIPGSIEREMKEEDAHGIRFSILRTTSANQGHTISGLVRVAEDDVSLFKAMKPRIALTPARSTQSPVDHSLASITLGFARVFEFDNLEAGEYKLTLLATRKPFMNKAVGSAIVTVDAQEPRVSRAVSFNPKGSMASTEISMAPLYGLLVAGFVALIVFKGDLLTGLLAPSQESAAPSSPKPGSGSGTSQNPKKKRKKQQ